MGEPRLKWDRRIWPQAKAKLFQQHIIPPIQLLFSCTLIMAHTQLLIFAVLVLPMAFVVSAAGRPSTCQAIVDYDVQLGPGFGADTGNLNFNGTLRIHNTAQQVALRRSFCAQ